jgi:hypothetical protein
MSEHPPPELPPELPSVKEERRAAEAAAIRRRWITLGELLAVVAVVISGLTLYLNWSDRSESAAEKAQERAGAERRAATLTLAATVADKGGRLDLRPVAVDQVVQSQRIRFPEALGAREVETTGAPRIEARWFDARLKRARNRAGLPDDSRGDEKLPVLIETSFVVGDETVSDLALYDIGYSIKGGGLLGGHELSLRGLSLVHRLGPRDAPAALERRWKRFVPAKKK